MSTNEILREDARRKDGTFGHWSRVEGATKLEARSRRRKSMAVTASLTGLLASVVLT